MNDEEGNALLGNGKNNVYGADNLGGDVILRVFSTGVRFSTGLASSYELKYNLIDMDKNHSSRYVIPAVNKIVPSEDIAHIMERLNDSIQTYWPCTTCFIFGKVCAPCTFGLSLACPDYCISKAESNAKEMLRNVSLKAKYFDRKIVFSLVKEKPASTMIQYAINAATCFYCQENPDSFIEIRFPAELLRPYDTLSDTEPTPNHFQPKMLVIDFTNKRKSN